MVFQSSSVDSTYHSSSRAGNLILRQFILLGFGFNKMEKLHHTSFFSVSNFTTFVKPLLSLIYYFKSMDLKIHLILVSTVEYTSLDLSVRLQHLKIWAHLTYRNSQYPVTGVQLLTN